MKIKSLTITVTAALLLAGLFMSCAELNNADYKALIDSGEFAKAGKVINHILATDTSLTILDRYNLAFEIERMNRIEKDFTKTEAEVIDYIREYLPNVTEDDIRRWENEKSLEMMMIDGEKRYFKYAARNLFRINKDCKAVWDERHKGEKPEATDSTRSKLVFNKLDQKIIDYYHRTGGKYSHPATRRIDYSITVNADAVPEGEIIRCWIPYPREIQDRQMNIKLLDTDPKQHIIAPNNLTLQRTIYFEKPAVKGEPTEFNVRYEYTIYGMYMDVIPENILPIDPEGSLKPFIQERPPHIVFSDTLRALSQKIVGDETNPFRIAQKLVQWIDDNIPWASAREYSTIRNLSEYPVTNGHGDCGLQAMLMITLCRLNGIPARWQSGWIFEPAFADYHNMHDWGMIYYEPYGWLPMDPDYGILESDNEELRYFLLHGMDHGRLICNDDYSQDFYPMKIHPRSETVDSQRGEVEWRGGNLYFDQWDYEMKYEILSE